MPQVEVREVCHSLAELFICLFEFIMVKGSGKFMKHFKGGESYRILGTSGLYSDESKDMR
jgi:hypothetical protein